MKPSERAEEVARVIGKKLVGSLILTGEELWDALPMFVEGIAAAITAAEREALESLKTATDIVVNHRDKLAEDYIKLYSQLRRWPELQAENARLREALEDALDWIGERSLPANAILTIIRNALRGSDEQDLKRHMEAARDE